MCVHVCACVCVCIKEQEREREEAIAHDVVNNALQHCAGDIGLLTCEIGVQ